MSERVAQADAVILIPSLEPDDRLPAYIRKLAEGGFAHVVVVDDGSSASYQPIFEEIAALGPVTVLHHDVNHGKGVALKTGYKWIMDNLTDISGVITADADGQHTVPDCIHLAEELKKGERALYLGTRDFSGPNVPPKSKSGNRTTSVLFKLLYGQWLEDTQTGLRAFRREDLPFMIDVEGERFEYEMNVLIACVRGKIPMIAIPIETIYENENKGTHYHPVKDSIRIFKVLAKGFLKFMGVSLLCVLLDQILFNILNITAFGNGSGASMRMTLIATVIARIISAGVNFTLNRNVVFKSRDKITNTLWKYIVNAAAVMIISGLCVGLLGRIGVPPLPAKLVVDTILYFLNYRIQQAWVFKA